MCGKSCVYSHDVHRDRGGQALTDVFENVIRWQEVGAPRNQVLLELQQLSAPTKKHLRCKHTDKSCRLQILPDFLADVNVVVNVSDLSTEQVMSSLLSFKWRKIKVLIIWIQNCIHCLQSTGRVSAGLEGLYRTELGSWSCYRRLDRWQTLQSCCHTAERGWFWCWDLSDTNQGNTHVGWSAGHTFRVHMGLSDQKLRQCVWSKPASNWE